jgi:heavy metal sensor kinase
VTLFRSFRSRLAAWYFLIIAAGLSVFGVGAWLGMRASLYHSIDESLGDRIQGVKHFMDEQISALSVNEIRDEFREHSVLGPGGDLFQVCDERGTWLYRSQPLENGQVSIRRPDELGVSPLIENIVVQKTPLRMASQRVLVGGRPYSVQVAAPIAEVLEALDRFRWTLIILIPVVLVVSSAGGYWISRRALKPVDQIAATAQSISIQNLSQRLSDPETGDELQRLSQTLNGMLARLEDSVRRIKQFTADASHELRAPVALIRTTAEFTLGRRRNPDEYERAMKQILIESERTTHLLDSLLTLARGDAGIESLELVRMDVAEALREAVAEGRRFAVEKRIVLHCEIPNGAIEINGDPDAIRRVFLILIDNAVKYTEPGGEVRAWVHASSDSAEAAVADTGIGIAKHDQPHIFDRFWRADKVRSRETGGVGLGLSIAHSIIDQHHGTILVESEPGKGSVFRVSLPLAPGA